VLLLETFVDPQRFQGTVSRAANWVYGGDTRGFRRTRFGYTATPQSPKDESLALDGKTMCNTLDDQGRQTHSMSVVGHQTQTCYTPKKLAPCR
jgi:hypothetical protein